MGAKSHRESAGTHESWGGGSDTSGGAIDRSGGRRGYFTGHRGPMGARSSAPYPWIRLWAKESQKVILPLREISPPDSGRLNYER